MVMKMRFLLCMMLMVAALATVAQADVYIAGRWASDDMETWLNTNLPDDARLGTIHRNRYSNFPDPAPVAGDLIIMLRETSSGDYMGNLEELLKWNNSPAAFINLAAYCVGNNKFGWMDSGTATDVSGAGLETEVLVPGDRYFTGVTVTGGQADLILDTNIKCASLPSDAVMAGSTLLSQADAGGVPQASVVRIALGSEWTTSNRGAGTGTHGGPRAIFFATSNDRTNGILSAITADGDLVLRNIVDEMLSYPIADAGADQSGFDSTVSILGTVTDPDPSETHTYLWSPVAGVTFGDDEDPNTTATFSDFGAYVLTVTATNSAGLAASDSLEVIVLDPGDASAPDPIDGATGVVQSPTLSWTSGDDSVSSDVWFGTDAGMTLVSEDQTETTYVVSDVLVKGQTYYWAVDETDSTAGFHDGTVWSFTVLGGGGTSNWTGSIDPNNPTSNLWSIETNWDGNGVPGVGSGVNIHANGPALIEDGVEAVSTGNWTRLGITGASADPNLDATCLNMTGGTLTTKSLAVGNGGPAIINMSGGTITVNGNVNFSDSYNASSRTYGKATLNMSGGTINITGQLSLLDRNDDNSMTLTGGVINMANIRLYSAADRTQKIDLAGGKMVLAGDQTAECIGMIDHPVMTGFISYGGTGSVMVTYDAVADETTVAGCPWDLNSDFSGDCAVNMDDFLLLAQDWLYVTPASAEWSFDMATDPVGPGTWDLTARGGIADYSMGDDTGTGTLELTGATTLDQQFAGTSGLFDTDLHVVIKSTNDFAVDFWFYMATSATVGQTNVGLSTMLDSVTGLQTVEFWQDGISRQQGGYDPFIETGFDPNNYLTIDVNYDYDIDTYAYTIDDGTNPVRSGNYAYAQTSNGTGGFYTIKSGVYGNGAGNAEPGTALIDQFDVAIAGSAPVVKLGDADEDGDVDLADLAALAKEWLLDGSL